MNNSERLNTVEITIAALQEAALEAADEERHAAIKIAMLKRDLAKLESEYVGARERGRVDKEVLRVTTLSVARRECRNREVEILGHYGIEVKLGDEVTPELKEKLREVSSYNYNLIG